MTTEVTRDFDAGAARYDLLVSLNPGYHRHLDEAARTLAAAVPDADALVDLGCGSGASTQALLRAFGRDPEITGLDASGGMLAQARAKQWPASVRFVQGRAGELAGVRVASGGEASEPAPPAVDGVLAAYLFRNVPADERDAALADTFAALRPGGALVVLEYSVAGSRRAASVWRSVCRAVIRPLALLTGGNPALYRHLERSVLEFDTMAMFKGRLMGVGFVDVESRTVTGWQRDILHVLSARRPL